MNQDHTYIYKNTKNKSDKRMSKLKSFRIFDKFYRQLNLNLFFFLTENCKIINQDHTEVQGYRTRSPFISLINFTEK